VGDPTAAAMTEAADHIWAAAVLALDPAGVGGAIVAPGWGSSCEAWLGLVRALSPHAAPWRRMPAHIDDDRLLGGLDLAATLAAGRPMVARGLMAEADGGIIIVPTAERLASGTAAQLAAVLDTHEVCLERDGFTRRLPARFGVIALDEGTGDDRLPESFVSRLALHVALPPRPDAVDTAYWSARVAQARACVHLVSTSQAVREAVCAAAIALGVGSLTAAHQTLKVARAIAALSGSKHVGEGDLALSARLVLGPRATRDPNHVEQTQAPSETHEAPAPSDESGPEEDVGALAERIVDAARAVLPDGLLTLLNEASARRGSPSNQAGRSGTKRLESKGGRTIGSRRGWPRSGARLDLIATLRAAAPWQKLRRISDSRQRVAVRGDDLRIRRLKQQAGSTTIFVVDASGSAALHRLAEAKGAVELLLSDCYVRRDQVAMVAFGGRGAETLLQPTRSPARARRSLSSLPGGGGTPLAAGLDAASALAEAAQRRGQTVGVVILTDGKANVARNGQTGRQAGEADAIAAAQSMRARTMSCIVVDTSPRPQPQAARLADTLGARYLPLPNADAGVLSLAARAQARSLV
jgi:magnesium chelatase subunit D